jgi:hypothetical protein
MAIVRMKIASCGDNSMAWMDYDDVKHEATAIIVWNRTGRSVRYEMRDSASGAMISSGSVASSAQEQTFSIPPPQRRDPDAISFAYWC